MKLSKFQYEMLQDLYAAKKTGDGCVEILIKERATCLSLLRREFIYIGSDMGGGASIAEANRLFKENGRVFAEITEKGQKIVSEVNKYCDVVQKNSAKNDDIHQCLVCNEQFDRKEIKRVYGDVYWSEYCSAKCYTDAMQLNKQNAPQKIGDVAFSKITVWTGENGPDTIHIYTVGMQGPFPFDTDSPVLEFKVKKGTGEKYVLKNFGVEPEVKSFDLV